ncbi:MAG: hypothetical protein AB7N76_29345 [Planctomycetota bacterium]
MNELCAECAALPARLHVSIWTPNGSTTITPASYAGPLPRELLARFVTIACSGELGRRAMDLRCPACGAEYSYAEDYEYYADEEQTLSRR